jgi:hypothetical protein
MRSQIVTLRLTHLPYTLSNDILLYNTHTNTYKVFDRVNYNGSLYNSVGVFLLDDNGDIIVEGQSKFRHGHLLAIESGKLKDGDKVILSAIGRTVSIKPLYANTTDRKLDMLHTFAEYVNDKAGHQLVSNRDVVKWFNDYKTKTKN